MKLINQPRFYWRFSDSSVLFLSSFLRNQTVSLSSLNMLRERFETFIYNQFAELDPAALAAVIEFGGGGIWHKELKVITKSINYRNSLLTFQDGFILKLLKTGTFLCVCFYVCACECASLSSFQRVCFVGPHQTPFKAFRRLRFQPRTGGCLASVRACPLFSQLRQSVPLVWLVGSELHVTSCP